MPRGPNVAYRQQKINWLLANPALWEDFPRGCQYFRIVDGLKDAGLIGRTTRWEDVRLHRLVLLAKEQRRQRLQEAA